MLRDFGGIIQNRHIREECILPCVLPKFRLCPTCTQAENFRNSSSKHIVGQTVRERRSRIFEATDDLKDSRKVSKYFLQNGDNVALVKKK